MIFVDENKPTSDRLFEMLPLFYTNSRIMKELMFVRGIELGKVQNVIDEVLAQLNIDTATWSINIWEEEYGVEETPVNTIEERRSVVKSRMNKGDSSYNELIVKIANSYTNGDVVVRFENGVVVTFNSFVGIPSNIEDVEEILRKSIPAHLPLLFEYRYLLIKDIHAVKTLNDIEKTTLNNFAGGGGNG
ncbi:putative phage tail protein [Virgibacillus halodenitrificans]|uniref:putative phage tail protein n=1 Tax=Virgibacillus halodenitrificans TaxID=1482 RepID=UPI000EF4A774|nr:putative phage tail protein [Virgibacillus halodenitrificans]